MCSSSDACDERLTDRYWLVTPAEEGEGELETVPSDLFEICRQLPPEFNLIKEVEKLCRISRTDPPNIDKGTKRNEEQRTKTRKPFSKSGVLIFGIVISQEFDCVIAVLPFLCIITQFEFLSHRVL